MSNYPPGHISTTDPRSPLYECPKGETRRVCFDSLTYVYYIEREVNGDIDFFNEDNNGWTESMNHMMTYETEEEALDALQSITQQGGTTL